MTFASEYLGPIVAKVATDRFVKMPGVRSQLSISVLTRTHAYCRHGILPANRVKIQKLAMNWPIVNGVPWSGSAVALD